MRAGLGAGLIWRGGRPGRESELVALRRVDAIWEVGVVWE